jgi:hypothetical protein
MSDVADYLAEVELALVSSPTVATYQDIRSWANTDDGYIRVRATLANGDFLEAAEYFVLEEGQLVTVDYRHQWMDGDRKTLRRRWDSTPDHPQLQNAPHHIHLNHERDVVPGHPVSMIELLNILEEEIPPTINI